MSEQPQSRFVEVGGLRLHYLEAGEGEPVLLLHGWPTSSFLWRNVMPPMAERNRVLALDLPGFGRSDKPLDASYSFRYYAQVLDGWVEALGLERLGLAVHDLGGPVGLYWACQRPERLTRLALLNTLVYPNPSWAVIFFVLCLRLPGLRSLLTSPWGLGQAMRLGVTERSRVTPEVLEGVRAPFVDRDARRALIKTGCNLSPKGFREIADKLPGLEVPVRIVYGERDRILPDVARTMARLRQDQPGAEVTALPDCGHFLQEEQPAQIGRLLADFFFDPGSRD